MVYHLGIWAVALAIADARLLRTDGQSLVVQGVANVEHARKLLQRAPVSCVNFEPLSGSASFSVGPEDMYDPEELLRKGWNATDCIRRRGVGAEEREEIALLVPTYPHHQLVYERLVKSVKENVVGPALLITVFSSISEGDNMTTACGSHCWAEEDSVTRSKPRLRSMIFNYGWQGVFNMSNFSQRANYQSAKKIWAIHQSEAEKVMVLDSDFSILRPIVIKDAIAPYEHLLYEMSIRDFKFDAFNYVHDQLWKFDNLLHIHTKDPRKLHFEQPWLYDRKMIGELVAYLAQQSATGSAVDKILKIPFIAFEILLYRRFVLYKSSNKTFFSKFIHTDRLWFDPGPKKIPTEADRLALTPPPIAVQHALQAKDPCNVCWLETHFDRIAYLEFKNDSFVVPTKPRPRKKARMKPKPKPM